MSNWALVIVTWPTIDAEADAHGHYERAKAIAGPELFAFIGTIGDGAFIRGAHTRDPVKAGNGLGIACESTLVLHINHFHSQHDLVDRVRALAWERPNEVCIIFKDEEDDQVHVDYPLRKPIDQGR